MSTDGPETPRHRSDAGDDTRDLLAAYALDAVDDLERARVERLLAEDADAAQEMADAREAAAWLGTSAAAAPPADLRARVLAEARQTRQLPPLPLERPARSAPAGRTSRATRWLAAAAGVLLVACAGLGAVVATQDREPAPVASPAEDGATVVGTGTLAAGSVALVRVGERYVVVGEDVPPPPDDRVYQLWTVPSGGTPEPAGFLTPTSGNTLLGSVEGLSSGETVAVTAEPAGGSPQPTGEILATVPT